MPTTPAVPNTVFRKGHTAQELWLESAAICRAAETERLDGSAHDTGLNMACTGLRSRADRRCERVDHRLDQAALELERGLVDHQARTDVADVLDADQAVGLERAAGGDEIDDDVRQADQRGEFHRAVELDEVDVHALGREMVARRVDVLGGDADACALLHLPRVVVALTHGDHHAAARDLQVERLVQAVSAMLVQHVLAGDAEVGGSVLHVGRNVAGAHDDEPHVGPVGTDDELARGLGVLGRRDACRRQQRQGFLEDAAFGEGEGDAGIAHVRCLSSTHPLDARA